MRSLVLLLSTIGLDCVRCAYNGYFIGPITDNVATVGGNIFAVDKTSIIVTNFTHDGSDPGTFIYAGTLKPDGSYTKTGYPLTNIQGIVEPIGSNVGQLLLQFPEGKSLYDVDWIGVLSRRKKKMIGRVLVTDTTKLNIPGPQVLGPLSGRGAMSGDVIALDSQTLMIKHLVFGGNQPDTYFMVGSGPRPGPFGVKIPDEDGSLEPLGPYRNRTIILTLPDTIDLMSLSWLSLWSHSLQSSFADIAIPRHLNIPPATRLIGIKPQHDHGQRRILIDDNQDQVVSDDKSKLNCEVLSGDVGLQVRWSVVSESIILQVVGNLGSEMYMAFGVKEKSGGRSPAAGDVVVGWINSQTGRGGLDDYFLSGSHTCSDGAESCPDSSKPGGQNNVEMLNSVSRDNYTMITFKRPLIAEDIYDTTIRINEKQEVFWSVGYKKAEKRMKHKPMRNPDPIYLDFGRLPLWNCPLDGEEMAEKPTNDKYDNVKPKLSDFNRVDDLESEPSINLRRKFKGKYQFSPGKGERRKVTRKNPVKILDDFLSPDYKAVSYDDYGGDYSYNDYNDDYSPNVNNIKVSQQPTKSSFSPQEIAVMKQKFEEKLKKDFPKRRDGQKTTLELIPELGQFVEPFFPKGPPPGAPPPPGAGGPPPMPAPATHPPPANDDNWRVPSIGCNTTDNTVFYLQIGPAAVRKGNQGLGQFGQAWYVNGDIAPDLYLVRGHTYTFIVEGGLGTDQEGIIHPFYLTSDNEGGYGTKSDYEARMEEIFGGLSRDRDGLPVPAIMGRLCLWRSARAPATYATYSDFKSSLKVSCQETGEPGVLRFTPDFDMPGVMYYQSFSEKLLGGKIHLLDQCHETLKSSAAPKENFPNKDRNPYKPPTSYNQSPSHGGGSKLYKYPTNNNAVKEAPVNQPPRRQDSRQQQKSKKKCPRKLTIGGMPEFEHFPAKEILKEGVSGVEEDDCVDMPFGSFDDWALEEGDYSDGGDYVDYVQPTRKPLIFKELLNTKPFEKRKYESQRPTYNYENNEVRRKDSASRPYDTIPDLPPPDNTFPNLFENLPGPYGKTGGFFGSFNTKHDNYPVTQSSYFTERPITAKIEKVTTYKPKPFYTTTPRPTYYERTSPSYNIRTSQRPSVYDDYNKRKDLDIDISNSGNSGMSVLKTPYQSPSPSPYDFYTPRPNRHSPTPTPYEFYTPSTSAPTTTTTPRPVRARPEPPKSDNYPSYYGEENVRRKSNNRPPPRQSPLQSLLNPFRNIFSFGGNRGPMGPPPPNRRQYVEEQRPTKESIPAPLPPPEDFPDFHQDEEALEVEENFQYGFDGQRKRRRKKRPRRPFVDTSYKQDYQSDMPMFQDLMNTRRSQYYDMDYSPSDKQETITTVLATQSLPAPTKQSEPGVFNPGSIESESGFVPVMPPNGNTPNLAFSIYDDDEETEYEEYQEYDEAMDRMDTLYDDNDYISDNGDRGNVVVPIPAPVLPYVPRSRSLDIPSSPDNAVSDPWDVAIMKNTGHHAVPQQYPDNEHGTKSVPQQYPEQQYPNVESRSKQMKEIMALDPIEENSADFSSFKTVAGADDGLKIRKVHDIHLTSQQLQSDGPLLLSVGSSLSYGSGQEPGTSIAVGSVSVPEYLQQGGSDTNLAYGVQHPSYIQHSVNTRLGADNVKHIQLSKDVVYGKMSETPTTPIKAIENVDERLLEKLNMLEKSGDKQRMKDYVTELWSIVEQTKSQGG